MAAGRRAIRSSAVCVLAYSFLGHGQQVSFSWPCVPLRRLSAPKGVGRFAEAAAIPAPPRVDHTGKAEGLLNQVRVPAALLAGIAFGAVFGMPLTVGDGFSLGMRKRVYVLMAACSLAAELVAIVSSTVGIMKLSEPREMPTYASPILLLRGELQFEWIATQFNFLFGLLMFAGAIALRAVSVIDCPNLAKSVSLLFVAVALHMYGIVNKFIRTLSGCDNIAGLGWQYFKLVLHQGGFLNYASIACMVAAAYYLGKVSSHTWHVTRAAVHVACS